MLALERGAAFLTPTHGRSPHLHIALTDLLSVPGYPAESLLLVTISSIRGSRSDDLACKLDVGEHDFITRPSYTAYRRARVRDAAYLRRREERGLIVPQSPVAAEILDRICAGLEQSPRTPEDMIAFYRAAERFRAAQ